MPHTNVEFYSLSTMPTTLKNGSFLNLTNQDNENLAGLYFCDGSNWRYLMNLDNEIKSAIVYGNVMYFYTTPTPPDPIYDSDSGSDVDLGDYAFFVELPEWLSEVIGGDGISVTNGNTVSVDLAQWATSGSTTTPHPNSENLLKIDSDHKLTIGDTWKCGRYDDKVYKHLLHLSSQKLVYEQISKYKIPDGVTVTPVSTVDSEPTASSPEYIKHSGNNWYYRLVGSKPDYTSLEPGEIAIQTTAGFERLYIKNTNQQIVEFRPAGRLNTVYNATFTNELLTESNSVCRWEIPYANIMNAGIGIYGAMVFLRENSTGRQLVPDVVFDTQNSKVVISLYSTTDIAAGSYTAIVMGSNYNDTH